MDDDILIAMIKQLFHTQLHALCKVTDGNGNTILHLAAQFGRNDLVEYLGTKLIDENCMNNNGRTALHLAVRYNNVSTVETFYETFKTESLTSIKLLGTEKQRCTLRLKLAVQR